MEKKKPHTKATVVALPPRSSISPSQAQQLLQRNGMQVTQEQANTITQFLYQLASSITHLKQTTK